MKRRMTTGDQIALQHSIYTALLAMYIAEYNIGVIKSQSNWLKGDRFLNEKKQDRFSNAVKEFRSDLLGSIKDTEKRQMLIDSLDKERIEALNSILMMLNRIDKTEHIEEVEEAISTSFK